jgi:acyl phosphate:glycerol-3-phosphate acyltransferase
MDIIIVILFSYLSGSIPFGLILTKIFGDQDIRNIGSGNIGATNVLRTGNKFLAALTLVLDILKGYIPVIIAQQYFPGLIQLSCLLAFLGHVFPVWLKFKGGKGVATYLGILLALSIPLGILFMFTWLTVSLIFKYSSLSSMFSSLAIFVITLIKGTALQSIASNTYVEEEIKLILFIFFILIIFTHRKNISNLKNKKEHKIKI